MLSSMVPLVFLIEGQRRLSDLEDQFPKMAFIISYIYSFQQKEG